jgi:hypothetical protein
VNGSADRRAVRRSQTPIGRIGLPSDGGGESAVLVHRLAKSSDTIAVGPGQLVAERRELTEWYGALAETTRLAEREENQTRRTFSDSLTARAGKLAAWDGRPAIRPTRNAWCPFCRLVQRAA